MINTPYPNLKQFTKLSQKGNLIPVYVEILSDMITPVSAYQNITSNSDYSFLLESVEGEEKVSRFSFIAKNPETIFESKNNKATVTHFKHGKSSTQHFDVTSTPIKFIQDIMAQYRFVNLPELPGFCGGMVGFMSYDIVRFFEKLPSITEDDLNIPDCLLMLSKELIIFDHRSKRIKILQCVEIDASNTIKQKEAAYKKALKSINNTISALNQPFEPKQNKRRLTRTNKVKLPVRSNLSENRFKDMVRQAKKEIKAGEIIQVVLSQRFEVGLKTDPLKVYRSLRALNPSPYMYFLNFKDIQIVGSSPELLVRCENKIVQTRPIAGTRPRGQTEQMDNDHAEDLLNDPKEKAEHIMLVDLGRNDLGRVCKEGSVYVSDFMNIERYSHVMHIVSNVKGELKKGCTDFDVLKAAFPAGTVSGAPKIRAMEIIEQLESQRRGPYAGCIGYFSFSGNLDTCITIRTIVIKNKKAYVQAGAGIVADSNPREEYKETLNKAKAQINAIEMAHKI